MEEQSRTMGTTVGIIAGGMTAAVAVAIGEIFTCASSGKGCVHFKNNFNLQDSWYVHLVNQLISPSHSQTEEGEVDENKKWEAIGTSIAAVLLGSGAASFIPMMIVKTTDKATAVSLPVMRAVSFALSAANLYWIAHLYKQVTDTYTERKAALETLKTEVKKQMGETSTTASDVQGTVVSDQRGIDNAFNESQDFLKGNCADGNLTEGEIKVDAGCKTPQKAKFSIPSNAIGNMSGFDTGGISTNPVDYGNALNDLVNGKGINQSLNQTGTTNAAVNQRVFKKLLKRLKDATAKVTGDPKAFNQIVAQEKKKNAKAYNNVISSIPKSLFDKLNTSFVKSEETKNEKINKKAKKEDNEFILPTMPEEGFEEFSEDGVHLGEPPL